MEQQLGAEVNRGVVTVTTPLQMARCPFCVCKEKAAGPGIPVCSTF